MATLKEPFALDRSLNTTEVTPRNIADVLAEGLSHITGRTASEVEYDNTDSGLTADNVQGAIDELSERPTLPSVDIQTAVDEFETYNGGLLSECKVALSPNQDLHGYAEPWVGGAGKNKLENSYTSRTVSGITFTVYSDGTIMAEEGGTSIGGADFVLGTFNSGGVATILNGCPSGGSSSTYMLNATGGYSDTGNGVNLPSTFNNQVYIRIRDGYTVPSGGLLFKPMIRLATESDPTFEPYSNICPISGHTQVEVGDDGKNRFNPNSYESFDITGGGVIRYGHEFDSGDYTLINNGTGINGYFYRIVAKDYSSYGTSVQITNNTSVNVNVDDAHFLRVFTASWDATADNIAVIEGTDETFVPYNGYQVTVNLGGTYYSGTLDVVSGVFTPDTAEKEYDGSNDEGWSIQNVIDGNTLFISTVNIPLPNYSTKYQCSVSNPNTAGSSTPTAGTYVYNSTLRVRVTPDVASTVSDFTTWLSNNPLQIVYKLDTPQTIQLTPQQVKALVGENHLSAPLDGQEITESKYRELFTWDEVEAYVNAHSGGGSGMNYSTNEQVIGTWIDGKPLYQKTIDFGALPNGNTKDLSHGIANIDKVWISNGFAYQPNGDFANQLSLCVPTSLSAGWYFGVNSSIIRCETASDRTNYSAYVTIQYTKTTD